MNLTVLWHFTFEQTHSCASFDVFTNKTSCVFEGLIHIY